MFIVGSKSIGQYGGYETFVDRLIGEHEHDASVKYHIACKANGDGCMDESALSGIRVLKKNRDGTAAEFEYRNAHVFKIPCPDIGPAVAVYYDRAALLYSIRYCRENRIEHPVFYILTCRIGLFIRSLTRQIRAAGGTCYLNPDGHEWKRAKWPLPVRKYWKWSEKKMVACADLVICDSLNIEKYIRAEYGTDKTTYIAYGADVEKSSLKDDDPKIADWLESKGLKAGGYYLIVGRFVRENNYETMIREFMKSSSSKDLAIITNMNDRLQQQLEETLGFSRDPRVKFVGTVYDRELLKKIRELAWAYLHGHEVGGTNPSLLEAMGSTDVNLLLDVGFNREVGQDAALYWTREEGNLAALIGKADALSPEEREKLGSAAKDRIREAYSWKFIGEEYRSVWRR